jgi:hypothetical protein
MQNLLISLINHINRKFTTTGDLHGLGLAEPGDIGTPAAAGKIALYDANGELPGTATQPAYASNTVTLSGIPVASDLVSITVAGVTVTYTVQSGDTLADVAIELAILINAEPTLSPTVDAQAVGNSVVITSEIPGSTGNAIPISVSYTGTTIPAVVGSTLSGGSTTLGGTQYFAVGSVVLGDAPAPSPGDIVTVTIDGNVINYTVLMGDTLDEIVSNLAGLINTDGTLSLIVSATTSGSTLIVTALLAGTAGNTITLLASITGASSATASGATLGGGAVATPAIPIRGEFQFSAFGDIDTAVVPTALDGLRRCQSDIELADFVVVVEVNGTAGTSTFDLQTCATPNGVYTSVLAAPVSITAAAGNNAVGTGTLVTTSFPVGTWFKTELTGTATDLSQVRAFAGYTQVN